MGGILMDRASAIRLAMLRTHSSRVQTFAAIVTPFGWSIRQILPAVRRQEVGLSQSLGKSGHSVSISGGDR